MHPTVSHVGRDKSTKKAKVNQRSHPNVGDGNRQLSRKTGAVGAGETKEGWGRGGDAGEPGVKL